MQRRRVASALTAALAAVLAAVLAGGAGGAVFELAPLQTARVSVLDIDQESVDGASGAVAALMAGLVAGVDFANDGEVVPTPAKGGDSYGGDGNTFEPVLGTQSRPSFCCTGSAPGSRRSSRLSRSRRRPA
jgi:hypothetical protein